MLFPTIDFALFFLVVFALGWLLRGRALVWKWCMLAASYFFYGYWDWRFVGLLVGSSLANHLLALWISRARRAGARRLALAAAVMLNLGVLVFFKYAAFFAQQAFWVMHRFSANASVESWLPVFNYLGSIILPVGISFFTFQALSYVIDVYRRQMEPAGCWMDFALYLAFFPQLVAGPIVRARDLIGQLAVPLTPRRADDSGRAVQENRGGQLPG